MPYTINNLMDNPYGAIDLKFNEAYHKISVIYDNLDRILESYGDTFKNVKDYGAIGNGINDDTAVLQSVLNQGGNILMPPGTYLHTGLSINKDNTILRGVGWGSKLLLKSTAIGSSIVCKKPLLPNGNSAGYLNSPIIMDLQIDGGYPFVRYREDDNSIHDGIRLDGTWGAKISNCLIHQHNGSGINCSGSNKQASVDTYIFRNKIENNQRNGVDFTDYTATLECIANIIGFHNLYGIRLGNVDTRVSLNHVFGCRNNIMIESMNNQVVANHCESAREHGIVAKGCSQAMIMNNTSVKNGRTSSSDLANGVESSAGQFAGFYVQKDDLGAICKDLIIVGNSTHSENVTEKTPNGKETLLQAYGIMIQDTQCYDQIVITNNNFRGAELGGIDKSYLPRAVVENNIPLNEHLAMPVSKYDLIGSTNLTYTLTIGAFANIGSFFNGAVAIFDIQFGYSGTGTAQTHGYFGDYVLTITKTGSGNYNYELAFVAGTDIAPTITETVVINNSTSFLLKLSIQSKKNIVINSVQKKTAIPKGYITIDQTLDDVYDYTLIGGQSNGERRHLYASTEYKNASENTNGYVYLNGASTGTPILTSNGGRWYNNSTDRIGGAGWQKFKDAILNYNTKALSKIKNMIWDHGESDYIKTFKNDYDLAVRAIFAEVRSFYLPNVNIYITIPNGTSASSISANLYDGTTPNEAAQNIREIYYGIINDLDYVYPGAERYDLPMIDNVHLTSSAYDTLALRDAHIVNGGSPGPTVSGVSISGSTVTVTLTHGDGNDFTPTTGIQGFYFTNNGTSITITSAVRTNATTITLTLASTPTGTKILYYVYGDRGVGITDLTKVVRDNSSLNMPLRSMKWLL